MEPVLGSDSLFTKRCARPTSSGDSTCQDMPQPQIQQDRQRQLGTASKWLTSHNQYTTHTISRLDLPVHLVPCACGCDRQTLPSDSDLLSTPPPHTHTSLVHQFGAGASPPACITSYIPHHPLTWYSRILLRFPDGSSRMRAMLSVRSLWRCSNVGSSPSAQLLVRVELGCAPGLAAAAATAAAAAVAMAAYSYWPISRITASRVLRSSFCVRGLQDGTGQ